MYPYLLDPRAKIKGARSRLVAYTKKSNVMLKLHSPLFQNMRAQWIQRVRETAVEREYLRRLVRQRCFGKTSSDALTCSTSPIAHELESMLRKSILDDAVDVACEYFLMDEPYVDSLFLCIIDTVSDILGRDI
jgi:type III secretory pathway component EscV